MAAGKVLVTVTPDLDPFYPAQEVRVSIEVFNADDENVDAGALTLTVRKPDDTEYLIDILSMGHPSTGHYYYDVLLDSSYDWRWRVESGGPDAAAEGKISVSGSVFTTGVPAPIGPGTGHEGEIARVTGGVYVPYAGSADQQPLIWRTGTGWVGQALNLAAAAAVSGLLAITHIAPGTPGQVLTTVAGPALAWAPGGGGSGVPGGNPNEIQYNNGGAFGGTGGIEAASAGNAFGFGSAYASSGMLRFENGAIGLGWRNAAGTQDITVSVDGSNQLFLGNVQAASVIASVISGGTFSVRINGITEYAFDSSALVMNGNAATGASFYSTSGTVAATGLFRAANNQSVVVARNAANTQDVVLLSITNGNDVFVGNVQAANVSASMATGGAFSILINGGGEYLFDSSSLSMNANNLLNVGFTTGGGTVAASGLHRFAHGVSALSGRNNANTLDAQIVNWGIDGTDIMGVGRDTSVNSVYYRASAEHRWHVASTQRAALTGTALTLAGVNLVLDSGFIQQGTNPAATGSMRLAHGLAGIIFRNGANSADLGGITFGQAATDKIQVGSTAVVEVEIKGLTLRNTFSSGGSFIIGEGGVTEYTFSSTAITMNNNNLVMGTGFASFGATPAGGGAVRLANTNSIKWRNSGASDVQGISVEADNAVYIGDAANAAAAYIVTAGTIGLRPNGAVGNEYTFSSTALSMLGNDLNGFGALNQTGTISTSGSVNLTNTASIARRNAGNTADIQALVMGDTLQVGDVNNGTGTTYDVSSGNLHTFRVAGSTELILSATQADFVNNDIVRGNVSDASATTFLMRGTGSTASNNSGGAVRITGGRRAGTGNYGGVHISLNQDDSTFHPMLEASHLANARRVLSLCLLGLVSTTNMPTNSGDAVTFVANAATNPSADAVSGHVYYSDSARPAWRFNSTNLRLDGTSTGANAGGVTNLPPTVTTFLTVTLNGTVGKIPVFAA